MKIPPEYSEFCFFSVYSRGSISQCRPWLFTLTEVLLFLFFFLLFFFLLLRDGKANSLVIPRMYKPFLSKSKLILCSDIFFEIRSSVILLRMKSSYCGSFFSRRPSSIIMNKNGVGLGKVDFRFNRLTFDDILIRTVF